MVGRKIRAPQDRAEGTVADIDHAIVVEVQARIEASLAGALAQRRLDDRHVVAIDKAVAVDVAHQVDREVGVRDVEENVANRLDLDARRAAGHQRQGHRAAAGVRRAGSQFVWVAQAAVNRQAEPHVRHADRCDVGFGHAPGDGHKVIYFFTSF
jgi:hypothetical protein